METPVQQNDALGKALSKILSGLYILTTGKGEDRQGILISWLMQAGFNPPRVTIAVGKDRPLVKRLEQHPEFVMNVMSTNCKHMMKPFSKYTPGEDQFEGIAHIENQYGIVLNECLAYLNCRLVTIVESDGDHVILLADVVDGRVLNEDLAPMVHIRKNGFFY